MESKNKLRLKIADSIFCGAFLCYNALSILIYFSRLQVQSLTAENSYKYVQYLLIIIFLGVLLMRDYNIKQLLTLSILLVVAAIGYYQTHEVRLMMFTLICFGAIGINVRYILSLDLCVRILMFSIVIFMNKLGIIDSLLLSRVGMQGIRNSLGFGHPNYGGAIFMTIVLEWLIVRYKKITVPEILILSGITIYFNHFFQSRTTLLLTLITICIIYLTKIIDKNKLQIFHFKIIQYLPIVLSILSFVPIVYLQKGNIFYDKINQLLSSRLDIFSYYYSVAGIHLIPKKIMYLFQDSTFVGMDNAYIYLGIYMGLVSLIIFCILQMDGIRKLIVFNKSEYLIVLVVFLFFGLTEALIIYPVINFSILFLYGDIGVNLKEKEEV